MFYLAAAVSDFYIPAYEMPEHKIQSSNGPLQVLYDKNKYEFSLLGQGFSLLDFRRPLQI